MLVPIPQSSCRVWVLLHRYGPEIDPVIVGVLEGEKIAEAGYVEDGPSGCSKFKLRDAADQEGSGIA
jgi:hypothetical protein